jgi:hypothetical protein
MSELAQLYKKRGVTDVISFDVRQELRPVQAYIYEHTRSWLVEHDESLPIGEKVQLPYARTPSDEEWDRLMWALNVSTESPLPELVQSPGIIEAFRELYGYRPKKFPICKFRASVAGRSKSQYNWHQDQGTWFVTKLKELAQAMPSTLWLSVNGADTTCSVEFALCSHKLQLLNHGFVKGQGLFQADVGQDIDAFETWKIQTKPGQGVIFHPLSLHRTVVHTSPRPRYSVDIRYSDPNMTMNHRTNWKFLLRRIWAGMTQTSVTYR